MTSILLEGPSVEPVSLAEAKAYLRVDHAHEDQLIQTLIAASRVHVEAATRRALIEQSWRVTADAWPGGRDVRLPIGPLQELLAIRVFDADGEATELELTQFIIEAGSAPGRIAMPRSVGGLPAAREKLAVEIDFVVGYGEAAEDVPAGLKQAMLVLIAHWFEHRDAVLMAGSGAIVPGGFDRVVAPYRVVSL
jgi:uncharacterized phiE125 gp8 family phage protein